MVTTSLNSQRDREREGRKGGGRRVATGRGEVERKVEREEEREGERERGREGDRG